jgi:hypothetical protein
MDLNLEQKQNLLEALHNRSIEHMQMYASGLITLTEFANALKELDSVFSQRIGTMTGLLCPNTGLHFPLNNEYDEFGVNTKNSFNTPPKEHGL